ncbi:lysozyme [Serratia ureilytica]|uniref:lysozyme n=1 Tax=Serratia ureilytica TaxID=300181 RepID=UPI00313C272A
MEVGFTSLMLIKRFEGLSLQAYPDPATGGKPWTIGYGHTTDVKPGDLITEELANEYLMKDLHIFSLTIKNHVNVPLTQNQFDALLSLAFNIGHGNFVKSTLLKKLNQMDYVSAADEFLRWKFAAGKLVPGLLNRRLAERELFLS